MPRRASLAGRDPYGAEKLFPPAQAGNDAAAPAAEPAAGRSEGETAGGAPEAGSGRAARKPWDQRFTRWTVHVDRRILERLGRAAKKTGRSRVDIVGAALDGYLRGIGF